MGRGKRHNVQSGRSTTSTGPAHIPSHGGPQTGNGVGAVKKVISLVFRTADGKRTK
jgi:hypothetical protein